MAKPDPLKILAALDGEDKPTTADLESAHTDLREALDAATKAEDPDLELARELSAGVKAIDKELTARREEAAKAREELKALRTGVFDDDDAKAAADAKAAEDAKAAADAAAAGDPAPGAGDPAPKVEEPVAASIVDRIKAIARDRVPEAPAPVVKRSTRHRGVGVASNFELENGDFNELGNLFSTHAKQIMNPGNPGHLFRLSRDYDESRQLGFNVDLNNQRMLSWFGAGQGQQTPLAAACGLCGPGDVDHSHPVCSEEGRPIRDALPQFQATRGKITFAPAMSIGDLSQNVSIWTLADDEAACAAGSPGSPGPTKPCPPILCPEELTCATDAVVRCVTVGNFQAQFSPEFWSSSLALLMAEFDRVAEQKIIEEIHDASVNLGVVDGCNTLASFLTGINSIVAADRSAQRNMTRRYRVIADAYIRDYLRNQVITNLGVANNIGSLQLADATINAWLNDVGVTPVWTFDGTFDGEQHRILLPGEIPADAGVYIQPEDAFVFLDGGTLDLGTDIHDSTLNATNDRQAFAESFEKTCFRGCSAYYFEIPVASGCGCGNVQCTSDSPALELV